MGKFGETANSEERLRLGCVGGGPESGIGSVDRYVSHMDGHYKLATGVFSGNPERNLTAGRAYAIADERVYPSHEIMAAAEATRPDGIHAVAIMAPNFLQVPTNQAFISHGIDVICDKPLSMSLDDGLALERQVFESGFTFVLMHNYSGLPMVQEARADFLGVNRSNLSCIG